VIGYAIGSMETAAEDIIRSLPKSALVTQTDRPPTMIVWARIYLQLWVPVECFLFSEGRLRLWPGGNRRLRQRSCQTNDMISGKVGHG
jgi:hypothetical protein